MILRLLGAALLGLAIFAFTEGVIMIVAGFLPDADQGTCVVPARLEHLCQRY